MGKIKPTLTINAAANTATTDPGPLSIALTLSQAASLDVTDVRSKIISPTDADNQTLWDEAAFTDGAETAGTDGGFVYLRNLHATANIFIGHKASAAALEGIGAADRIMTLKPGEFAFFPWDFTADIIVDASTTATNGLESWVFTRTQ